MNNNFGKTLFVLFIGIFLLSIIRCNDSRSIVENNNCSTLGVHEISFQNEYQDSVFLGFEGNLLDHETIWNNVAIYLPAFNRMKKHVYIENNQLRWNFRNGADLKISENIYEYVVNIWKRQNKMLESGEFDVFINDAGIRLISLNLNRRSTEQGTFSLSVLREGAHRNNMSILRSIYTNCTAANLAHEIDLENSDMPGGSIIGRGTSKKGDWSYWCENACVHIGKVDCIYNGISHPDSDLIGTIFYEKVLNISNLPLITIQNYRYFE